MSHNVTAEVSGQAEVSGSPALARNEPGRGNLIPRPTDHNPPPGRGIRGRRPGSFLAKAAASDTSASPATHAWPAP
jgi:hypothetical protein